MPCWKTASRLRRWGWIPVKTGVTMKPGFPLSGKTDRATDFQLTLSKFLSFNPRVI